MKRINGMHGRGRAGGRPSPGKGQRAPESQPIHQYNARICELEVSLNPTLRSRQSKRARTGRRMDAKIPGVAFISAALALSSLLITGHGQDFGYDGNIGPNHWGEKYQQCVGKHQSPINIQEHDVRTVHLPPMEFKNFDVMAKSFLLKNNGHTVVISLDTDKKPIITGGPLVGDYELVQFHFHWGANDSEGSENTINNNSFPMELHLVFYQKDYESLEKATDHPDGLAVLSFLFSKADDRNINYKSLLDALTLIQNPHMSTTIENPPALEKLITKDLSVYFTYGGSLTTPPCSEVVTWIEFKNTIPLAHEQIEQFRKLNTESGKMIHNFRPVQPLHGRIIRMNIDATNEPSPRSSNDTSQKSSVSSIYTPQQTLFASVSLFFLSFILLG